jgi:hypothetical protein
LRLELTHYEKLILFVRENKATPQQGVELPLLDVMLAKDIESSQEEGRGE